MFNITLGLKNELDNFKIIERKAVRAIILKNNKVLMVHNQKGDFKFPGGGIDRGESHNQTLKREVREETGYIISKINDKLGEVTESKLDQYEENTIFKMKSYYYLCEVLEDRVKQQLDDYEKELHFQPKWVGLDEAIELNENILNKKDSNISPWVYRETCVLKEIKKLL